MHALALRVELRLAEAHSLKAKRSLIAPILEGSRRRYRVASAETDHQDSWQRAELGFAAVGAAAGYVAEVIDAVERFVWSFPEVEVVDVTRAWLEDA